MAKHPTFRTFFVAIFALLIFPVSANAQEGSISAAVLNLEGDGVDKELTSTLTSIVRNEAQQVDRYKVVNKYEINFEDILVVLGCKAESPSCLKQAAAKVEARLLIFGTVSRRDSAYRITLNIFDAETAKMVNRLVRTIGETDDPVVAFRKEIETFFRRERAVPSTRVQIGSNVEDAKIEIDDTYVGMVPLERKGLPAGEYEIRVHHPDYQPWTTVLELKDGADVQLWAPLSPKSEAQLAKETPPDRGEHGVSTSSKGVDTVVAEDGTGEPTGRVGTFNWGAWSAIGVGAAALGGSGVFALLMSGVEDDINSERERGVLTQRRYDELVNRGESYELTHQVLLGVGLVGVTSGVVWLLLEDTDEAPSESAGLDVGIRPDGVSASLRW